jgi:hypothetical protein
MTTVHPLAPALKAMLAGALLMLAGGCASDADSPPLTVAEVPSAFTNKVAGSWLLVVADRPLDTRVEAPGLACGGLDFPVEMDALFRRYLVQSFRQVADDIVPADHAATGDELRQQGYAGQIVIAPATLVPNVAFAQDGLTALVDSHVELAATMDVSGRRGVLLHRAFASTGISHADVGIVCQRGSRAIARAMGSAMQQLSVASASAFGNAPDIRLAVQHIAGAGRN